VRAIGAQNGVRRHDTALGVVVGLVGVFDANAGYDFEVICVENGSEDATWDKLLAVHDRHPRFKTLRMARNFRMDGRLTAGVMRGMFFWTGFRP
jgi:hypothetical protein